MYMKVADEIKFETLYAVGAVGALGNNANCLFCNRRFRSVKIGYFHI